MFRIRPLVFLVTTTAALPAQQFFDFDAALPPLPLGPLGFMPEAATLADVDGDGDRDILIALFGPTGPSMVLLRNDGTGQFGVEPTTVLSSVAISSIAVGDLDGDGDPDVVLGGASEVWLNDGVGGFARRANALSFGATEFAPLELVDLEGDGDLDLVAPRRSAVDRIYLNDGSGSFSLAPAPLSEIAQFSVAALSGDIDGDGDLDLVSVGTISNQPTLSRVGLVQVQRNRGDGTFENVSRSSVPTGLTVAATSAVLGDFDRDGDPDLVISELGADRLFVNDGGGVFTELLSAFPGRGGANNVGSGIEAFDYDEDGDLDLLIATSDLPRLFTNDGGGRFTLVPPGFAPAGVGQIDALAVGDLDDDGDLDALILRPTLFGLGGGRSAVWMNRRRHLRAVQPPSIGMTFVLDVASRPSGASSMRLAVPFVGTMRTRIPFGSFGVLGLDPGSMAQLRQRIVAVGADAVRMPIDVPNRIELVGQAFVFQALIVHPIEQARLTNTLRVIVR